MEEEGWVQEEESTTTLHEMDALITSLRAARDVYDAASEAKTEAHNKVEALEKAVLQTLQSNKRSKYAVDGIGTAYIISKEVYRTPKTNEEKKSLFDYIKSKYGPEALMSMVGINHQSLNSWANKESEEGVMSIPGLEAPTMLESIGMRKK